MARVYLKDLGVSDPKDAEKIIGSLNKMSESERALELYKLSKTQSESANAASTFDDKVKQIQGLKDDNYHDTAVGPNALARTSLTSFITGGKQKFMGGVQQLTNQETMDALLKLKAAGGTLGALNESEGKMLRDAATKINNWAIRDESGNVTGYNVDEASFKAELDRLKELAQKASDAAKGITTNQNGGQVKTGVTSTGLKYTIE